jgi:hypothetical protein
MDKVLKDFFISYRGVDQLFKRRWSKREKANIRRIMKDYIWLPASGVITLLVFALSSCGVGSGGNSNTVGTSTSGPVSIRTDHAKYKPDDGIMVSVTNHLSTSIFAYDTRASCTILDLQVQVNGLWQDTPIARCSLGRSAIRVEIAAGKIYTATISAGSPGLRTASFPAGTYRLLLNYFTSATPQGQNEKTTTISSAPLVIADAPTQ